MEPALNSDLNTDRIDRSLIVGVIELQSVDKPFLIVMRGM